MNKYHLKVLILIVFAGFFTSCTEDDETADCITIPAVQTNIIGVWLVDGKEVTFFADGTFIDEEDALILASLFDEELVSRTYEIPNDSRLTLIGTDINGLVQPQENDIVSNDCEEIALNLSGIAPVTMFRKEQ